MIAWDVNLTYIGSPGDAGDQYAGLDRFGRIVKLRWDDTNSATDAVSLQYGYDRNGNRLYAENLVNSEFSELYHADGANGYDGLNQLVEFQRGELESGNDEIVSETRSQAWSPDAVGNFNEVSEDGTPVSRVHDAQNRLLEVGSDTLTYDKAGNMTTDETGREFGYDAWNRLVTVDESPTNSYDALNRRTIEGGITLYYSAQWQVVEEYDGEYLSYSYAWSPVYVDCMIARDGGEDRHYALTDANWNVVAIADTFGDVKERYVYDPYGKFEKFNSAWEALEVDNNWVYLHQGGRWNDTTDLFHFRNRDYSPTLMRWNRLDPIGFGGGDSNLFGYEFNRPTIFVDPTGEFVPLIIIGGIALGSIIIPGCDRIPSKNERICASWGCAGTSRGNCYRFACDDPMKELKPYTYDHSYTPGGGAVDLAGEAPPCKGWIERMKKDGFVELDANGKCPEGYYAVALLMDNKNTGSIHFLRQMEDGSWCGKDGRQSANCKDDNGREIKDPKKAHFKKYPDYCCTMCWKKGAKLPPAIDTGPLGSPRNPRK